MAAASVYAAEDILRLDVSYETDDALEHKNELVEAGNCLLAHLKTAERTLEVALRDDVSNPPKAHEIRSTAARCLSQDGCAVTEDDMVIKLFCDTYLELIKGLLDIIDQLKMLAGKSHFRSLLALSFPDL